MAEAVMAYPELRHPFEETPIHPPGSTTVLHEGRTVTLAETGDGNGLLIRPKDLPRVNGFELKPEGACRDSLCIPINDDLLISGPDGQWFDLAAFADLTGQPYVADRSAGVWSFGEVPATRERMMADAMVPDFEVTDRQGNTVTTADLKGRKALIVTWSSW